MSVNEIPDTPQAGGLQVGLRALILALLASWLLWEFGRVMVSITAAWGLAAALTDSIALHRFGELLIVLPLATFALLGPTWMAARRVEYARRVRWVVWAGAVLNAAAWLSLRQRVDWSWWSLALAFLGLLIPLALGWSARRDRQFPSMLLLVLWILLHLASSFTAFLSTGYALGPFPIAPPRPTADRDERWRQDIRYLASEMERLHKNLYHTTSPEVFGAEAARLVAEVPNLQDHEIAVGLMRLVASVGDAHTEFPLQGEMNLHRYPLVLYWFREGPELGLYVIAAAPDYADTLGAKVNAIEGIQSQLLLEAVTPLISHENQSWLLLKSPNYLVTAEVLQAVGVLAQLGPAEFDLEDAAGRRTTRVVSPLEPGQMVDFQPALAEASRPLYVSRPQEDFWYEYLEDERTLYFRYNHCTDPLGFRRVTREFWRFTDEHEVQRVVVDLRSNGGGNSYQFNLWFLPGIQMRPELNRPDRLYLLINRGSFSAASQNAIDMDLQTEATVVGEATGGKPNGYGEVRALRLPNSGWQGWYSTNYFSQVEGDPPSLMPEVPVDMTAKAYFSGEDPVLEAVLEGG